MSIFFPLFFYGNLSVWIDPFKELREKLERKDAEIYIMRSKKMSDESANGACPTQLFTWCMNDVSIVALADASFHGKTKVMEVMKELDPGSPMPAEGEMSFSILWCRAVQMTCSEWTFRLRDYPQPLLDIRQFQTFGKLVGAEQAPTWRGEVSY